MKTHGLLIGLIFFSSIGFSQYETPGTGVNWGLTDFVEHSSGAVTFQEDIYFFNEDIIISVQDTFQILTDEVVRVDQDKLLTVYGVLLADPPEEIVFSAIDTTQNYLGFRFEESSASMLSKCKMEFGGGIKLIESDMIFENCIFRKNNTENCIGEINMASSV